MGSVMDGREAVKINGQKLKGDRLFRRNFQRDRLRERTYGCRGKDEGKEGIVWEFGMDMDTLLYFK